MRTAYFIFFVFCILSFSSCEKDDTGKNPNHQPDSDLYKPDPEILEKLNLKGINDIFCDLNENQPYVVDLFYQPEIQFSQSIGKEFAYEDKVVYKTKVDYFIVKTPDGEELKGDLLWNKDSTNVQFKPKDILPSDQSYDIEVKVHQEVYVNGEWEEVENDNNDEIYSWTFKTGEFYPLKSKLPNY